MMRIVIFLFTLIFHFNLAFAQPIDYAAKNINNLVPPSPEAANLARYVEIPVSNYTGVPNISIPIWNVKQGELQVPISLSYHTAGIRVEEFASWVGLGWTLNAGGIVTRTVRGLPDDINLATNFSNFSSQYNYEYLTGTASNSDPRGSVLSLLVQGCADSEPDLFFFNFGDYTGKIMYQWGGEIKVSCSKPVKVQDIRGYGNAPNQILGWKITTGDGITYQFNDIEQTNSGNNSGISCIGETPIINSSWLLTEISDLNGENKINFEYEDYVLTKNINNSSSITYYSHNVSGSGNIVHNNAITNYYGKRIKRITTSSSGLSINFNAGSNRTDVDGLYNASNPSDNNNLRVLGEIQVLYNSAQIKTFELTYNYEFSRLALKKITEKGIDGQMLPPHEFIYHSGNLPPLNSNAQDHWGFFNGATNQNLIPSAWVSVPNSAFHQGADRSVNPNTSQIGLIRKIIYPTGGSVEFEFEQNEYGFIQNQSIESQCVTNFNLTGYDLLSNPNSTEPVERHFSINPIECNGNIQNISTLVTINYQGYNYDQFAINKPLVELLNSNGSVIFSYDFGVTSGFNPQTGSVSYTLPSGNYTLRALGFYPNSTNPSNVPGNFASIYVEFQQPGTIKKAEYTGGVRIKSIRESTGSFGNSSKIRTFKYSMIDDDNKSSGVIYQKPVYQYSGNKIFNAADLYQTGGGVACNVVNVTFETRMSSNPFILGSTQGSHVGYRNVTVTLVGDNKFSGQSEFIYTSPYEYPDIIDFSPPFAPPTGKSYATGLLKCQNDYLYDGLNRQIVSKIENDYLLHEIEVKALKMGSIATTNCAIGSCCMSYFLYGKYSNQIGYAQLKSTKRTLFDKNVPSKSLVLLEEYLYDQSKQRIKQTIRSNSNGSKDHVDYFYPDEVTNPSPTISLLKSKFFINHPIEVIKSLSTNSNDRKVISAIYTDYRIEGNSLLRLNRVFSLNASNSLSLNSFPLAIYNSNGEKSLFYNQIEDIHFQNYSSNGKILQIKKRGEGPITFLWGYNQELVVARILNKQYSEVISQSGVNLDILNNPENIDAFRLELRKVQSLNQSLVFGYIHKPFVGIMEEISSNDKSVIYDYDAFSRLKQIKDSEGNIIKQFCYNYAGQPISCGPQTFLSDAYSANFTRTNCGVGFIGGAVPFSAPQGMFSSTISQLDANQQAINYVNQNGQANANSLGSCTPVGQSGPCEFQPDNSISIPSYSFYSDGSSTSGYMVVFLPNGFTSGSTISLGYFNSGGCKPSSDRTQTFNSGGNIFIVTFYAYGGIDIRLENSYPSMPSGSTIILNDILFNQ